MKTEFTSIGLVGAGLIGGSIAARMARVMPDVALLVHDLSPGNAAYVAERHPGAQFAVSLDDLTGCDAIFVATPVSAIQGQVIELLSQVHSVAFIIDTGSAKSAIVEAVAQSGADAGRFVPGHPLAGGVSTGPGLARSNLLVSRPYVLTPTAETDPQALANARVLLEDLGMEVVEMAATEHDRLLAVGSHLPHLMAFALAGLADPDHDRLLPSSFRGVAAFAGADPQMWADIFRANSAELKETLENFKKRLDLIAAMADEPAPGALIELLTDARDRIATLEEQT